MLLVVNVMVEVEVVFGKLVVVVDVTKVVVVSDILFDDCVKGVFVNGTLSFVEFFKAFGSDDAYQQRGK